MEKEKKAVRVPKPNGAPQSLRPCVGCAPGEEIRGAVRMSPDTKRATVPEGNPMYCRQKCAFESLMKMHYEGGGFVAWRWCHLHRCWYNASGCKECAQ